MPELKDEFAAAALTGLISADYLRRFCNPDGPDVPADRYRPLTKTAYRIAEAMIAEREASQVEGGFGVV